MEGVEVMSEGSCMLSEGDSLRKNRERPVSVALITCCLVSQCLPTLGKGGVCGVWVLSEGSCVLTGGVVVPKQEGKGQ